MIIGLLLHFAVAGFTIFLGLPLALLPHLTSKQKGFLNAFALGILIFLIIDVFSQSWESAESATEDAFAGNASWGDVTLDLIALFGDLTIGLLALAWYERKAMTDRVPNILTLENRN